MQKQSVRKFTYSIPLDVMGRVFDGMASSVNVYDERMIGLMVRETPSYRLDAEAVKGDVERAKERFNREFGRYGAAKAG